MDSYSPRRSSGPVLRSSEKTNRHFSAGTPPSSFASATSSAFSTPRSFHRPTSPTRRNPTSHSFSFSLNRPGSPNRPISVSTRTEPVHQKMTCMCSPTNHPGSFRCSLHKSGVVSSKPRTASYAGSTRLNMVRSAMKNSLVRISAVEGELVKRALAALIRPSSHQQRRRGEFRPRLSRLSVFSG